MPGWGFGGSAALAGLILGLLAWSPGCGVVSAVKHGDGGVGAVGGNGTVGAAGGSGGAPDAGGDARVTADGGGGSPPDTGGGGGGAGGRGGTVGSGGARGSGGAAGAAAGTGGGGTGGSTPACAGSGVSTGCSDGLNCAAGKCVAATVSCAGQKASHPTSGDGVYWIGPPNMRAYCDMSLQVALCTEVTGEHSGKTRDGSNVTFALTSLLLASQGECLLSALRTLPEGIPFAGLQNPHPLTTCQALGFIADGQLGSCAYGDSAGRTNCGFNAPPLFQMGDQCSGCIDGDGAHDLYTRMGPIHSSSVLTSFDPSTQTHCKVR